MSLGFILEMRRCFLAEIKEELVAVVTFEEENHLREGWKMKRATVVVVVVEVDNCCFCEIVSTVSC